MKDDSYLLVGLGNPGLKYKDTRHNLGFMIVDKIAQVHNCVFKHKSDLYSITKTRFNVKNVILAKPMTYMNRSGVAVIELLKKYKIPLRNLLILLDDFNLPFGKIRLRSKGSDGGHNGLASIIYEMSRLDFPRLRVGIGTENIIDPIRFVLSDFGQDEQKRLPHILQESYEASLHFVVHGINTTMNTSN